ncbi:MAG TPA: hypothetical protein VK116_04880, partial [Planctomycetota bacterium]|nr:hypothetical protein [Planctomycetota bacterium]
MSVDAPSFGSVGERATTPRFQLIISAAPPDVLGSCSAAFWIILEKLGFLDFELTDLDAYEKRRDSLGLHIGILTAPVVARLDERRLAKLLESPVPLLIEGPWDTSLDQVMGIQLLREEPAVINKACWAARWLEDRLDRFLDGIACPSSSRAYRKGEPLLVSARSTREHRQSEHESRFAG